jgi:uncharacterized protein
VKTIRRIALPLFGATVLLGLSAAVASAHVTVNSPGATEGGYAVIAFRVPTESDTASTIGLRVQLPTDTPFASVAVEAKPGWSYTVKKVKLSTPINTDDGPVSEAIGEVDWTATTGGIKPGEFAEFRISAGPLPDKSTVTFKAIQLYSDNTTVSWVEVPAAGSSAEPEHPAPTLTLVPASGAAPTSAAPSSAAGDAHNHDATASTDYAKQSGVTTALITSAIAVLLAAAGCALGFVAWRRTHP